MMTKEEYRAELKRLYGMTKRGQDKITEITEREANVRYSNWAAFLNGVDRALSEEKLETLVHVLRRKVGEE